MIGGWGYLVAHPPFAVSRLGDPVRVRAPPRRSMPELIRVPKTPQGQRWGRQPWRTKSPDPNSFTDRSRGMTYLTSPLARRKGRATRNYAVIALDTGSREEARAQHPMEDGP
jgi:hypothetical protein